MTDRDVLVAFRLLAWPLVEQWRAEAAQAIDDGRAVTLDDCADELSALLSSLEADARHPAGQEAPR